LLPPLDGKSVRIHFWPGLTADQKRLYSNKSRGIPVHAGAFIRKRKIVLDSELRESPRELARILVHEIFHFAWVRLSNQARVSYEHLIRREFAVGARGELGWSAESLKRSIPRRHGVASDGKKWRDYLCESFCDTAAWLYSGTRNHAEFTLAATFRSRRAKWFESTFGAAGIPI